MGGWRTRRDISHSRVSSAVLIVINMTSSPVDKLLDMMVEFSSTWKMLKRAPKKHSRLEMFRSSHQ